MPLVFRRTTRNQNTPQDEIYCSNKVEDKDASPSHTDCPNRIRTWRKRIFLCSSTFPRSHGSSEYPKRFHHDRTWCSINGTLGLCERGNEKAPSEKRETIRKIRFRSTGQKRRVTTERQSRVWPMPIETASTPANELRDMYCVVVFCPC